MAILKDSGARLIFDSGAVRDISDGKGRMDLMPLDIMADYIHHLIDNGLIAADDLLKHEICASILYKLDSFVRTGSIAGIFDAIHALTVIMPQDEKETGLPDTPLYRNFVATSRQMEDGAAKYAARNWEKGINAENYINSGIRHLLKFMEGWTDEPHDRAALWNMYCLLWTIKHHPELNCYPVTH